MLSNREVFPTSWLAPLDIVPFGHPYWSLSHQPVRVLCSGDLHKPNYRLGSRHWVSAHWYSWVRTMSTQLKHEHTALVGVARHYSLSLQSQTMIGTYLGLSRADLRWASPVDGTCINHLIDRLPRFNYVGVWTISGWVMMNADWARMQAALDYQHWHHFAKTS